MSALRSDAGRSAPSWKSLVPTPRRASSLYLMALSMVVFALWIPHLFYTTATFRVVASSQAATVVIALAVLVPFTTGVFDLSAGYMAGFSLVILSWLRMHSSINVWLASLIAILVCGAVGAVSGVITTRYRVNSFIATLGMGQVLFALTLYLSANQQIVGVLPAGFLNAGQGNWLGVPRPLYYLVTVGLILYYILEWTPLGRNMFACGANTEAARLVGIPTERLMILSLAMSGVIAGFAGVLLGSQIGLFSNSFGAPLLFPAFAALFFGSTQFRQRPNVWGTIVASYVLAYGVQGLQLGSAGGSYWITPLFDGAALLIAVGLASRTPQARSAMRSWRRAPQDSDPKTEPGNPVADTVPAPAPRTGSGVGR
jgi:ribose transport system permease protein